MHTNSKIMIAVVVGVAIGAAATQGLHAQAKLKAYSISQNEITDSAAVAKYLPAVRKAIADNHGKSLLTLRGRVVPIEGAAPPSNVGRMGQRRRCSSVLQVTRLEGLRC